MSVVPKSRSTAPKSSYADFTTRSRPLRKTSRMISRKGFPSRISASMSIRPPDPLAQCVERALKLFGAGLPKHVRRQPIQIGRDRLHHLDHRQLSAISFRQADGMLKRFQDHTGRVGHVENILKTVHWLNPIGPVPCCKVLCHNAAPPGVDFRQAWGATIWSSCPIAGVLTEAAAEASDAGSVCESRADQSSSKTGVMKPSGFTVRTAHSTWAQDELRRCPRSEGRRCRYVPRCPCR